MASFLCRSDANSINIAGWRCHPRLAFPRGRPLPAGSTAASASRSRHTRRARSTGYLCRSRAQLGSRNRASWPCSPFLQPRCRERVRRHCGRDAHLGRSQPSIRQFGAEGGACEPARDSCRAKPIDQVRDATYRIAAGRRGGNANRPSRALRRARGALAGASDHTVDGVHFALPDDRDRDTLGAAHHRHAGKGPVTQYPLRASNTRSPGRTARRAISCHWKEPPLRNCDLASTMLPDFVRSLCRAIAGIFHDNTGATATMLAIALPGLIGIGALGVETGVWFTIKLQNQSAADSAAISAAYEVIAGKTNVSGELTAAADEAAKRNGYKGSTPVVVYPYNNGSITNGIAVTLQQGKGALLAAMFLSGVSVVNTTVAVIEAFDSPCILALGTSATGVEVAQFAQLE